MLEACSRLREMPCKWLACGSVLNSFENLVTHLYEVHAQEDEELAVSEIIGTGLRCLTRTADVYVGFVWGELLGLEAARVAFRDPRPRHNTLRASR